MAYRTARPILRKRGPVPLSRDLANRADHELLLARRHALPSLHPLNEDCLGVADGTADLEVGRSVTAHAGLGRATTSSREGNGPPLSASANARCRRRSWWFGQSYWFPQGLVVDVGGSCPGGGKKIGAAIIAVIRMIRSGGLEPSIFGRWSREWLRSTLDRNRVLRAPEISPALPQEWQP